MTSAADHYQTLGVMPEAEQIVITAAYRALASRYHPDRWKGDKDEATRMMSKINVAYGVLGDPEKRKAYDASRGHSRSAFSEQTDETEDAFEEAIHDYDERWETACSVYPDLNKLRSTLTQTSRTLAFNFVVRILETKQFEKRDALAEQMERMFLERHFGTNPKIIIYARTLIHMGARNAIKHLNKLVDVLGDEADADKIIQKVESVYLAGLMEKRAEAEKRTEAEKRAEAAKRAEKETERLRILTVSDPCGGAAFKYAAAMGYWVGSNRTFSIRRSPSSPILFSASSRDPLCYWIRDNIALAKE